MPARRLPLPPRLVEQARSFAEGSAVPAEPRDAATVVLLREGRDASGPELYLLRRQASMAFAAGMNVFPGGGVDPRDFDAAVGWAGPSPAEWAERLACPEDLARALVCAAVRETFEESGVLLAGPTAETVVDDTTDASWESDRTALESRALAFTDFLSQRQLVLRTDLLGAWSGWTTPVFEPRRFRTWFFVAAMPTGQVTRDVSSESSSVAWVPAAEAVRAVEADEMTMMPPTFLTCLDLARFADPAAVLAEAASRRVEMFTPTAERSGDDVVLSTPPHYAALLAELPTPGGAP